MKSILCIGAHPATAATVESGLDPAEFRLVARPDITEAEPLLVKGLANACILDVEGAQVEGLWQIEHIRKWAPLCPLIVLTGASGWDWEEDAYVQGAAVVMRKPIHARALKIVLDRLVRAAVSVPITPAPIVLPPPVQPPVQDYETRATHRPPSAFQALGVLRDFTTVLTHSLCADGMLKEFLLRLREILGVNRAVIFVRRPSGLFGKQLTPEGSRCLRSACAIGVSPGLLEHFELSFETGIGGYLVRQGRILRRGSPDAFTNVEIQKEFELLGVEVAIPMVDRENLIGVAAFDGRVTGEPLANGELELIFHLLEELGLAVKNIWLHDQLVANHEMMADILRELSSACVVVSHDLTILHANRRARQYFTRPGQRSADLEFSDLPMLLGSKVYQVLKTGAAIAPFKYEVPEVPNTIYKVTIIPFHQGSAPPNSALLVVEDQSREQHLQKLEIETANLRLIKSMADRLAHEIGNALVPLSTHQQLLPSQYKDPEFRASLGVALAEGVKRISRLSNQMRFLARDEVLTMEPLHLSKLVDEAFQEAQQYQQAKSAQLVQEDTARSLVVSGDPAALKHAMAEILLNAMQANPSEARVNVRARVEPVQNGNRTVQIEIQDNGAGFTEESFQKAVQPFYTTRNVGLGLGLAVSRKIIESHRGHLDIVPPRQGQAGVVRVTLPAALGEKPKAQNA